MKYKITMKEIEEMDNEQFEECFKSFKFEGIKGKSYKELFLYEADKRNIKLKNFLGDEI